MLAGALLLASPTLLFKPKTRAGLKEKIGLMPGDLQDKLSQCNLPIWIHAVSVGEFNGAFPLIAAIKTKFPHHSIIVSTTTKAGHAVAEQRAGKMAQIIYFPFDLPWIVERILALINPVLVVIFETELWPNFISTCRRRHVPVVLLNARMSPRSFKGYKAIKPLFSPLLSKLTLIGAQTEREAEQYRLLAGTDVPIKVFGNLKYDWPANIDDHKCNQLRMDLGIGEQDLVVVAGSTHADEEKMILNLYKHCPNVKIIIAPRHPERFEEVASLIQSDGCTAIRYSQSGKFIHERDVYLLDTIGMLADYYSIASIAFVGGSLAKVGGHNLLEPYLYAVPVVCGPHLDKTRETAAILSNEKALFIGADAKEIESKMMMLLQDEALRKKMGAIGQSWLNNNRGAVDRSMVAIAHLLESSHTKTKQAVTL